MSTANLTREETAARAAAHTLHTIDVELDLTQAADHSVAGFPTRTILTFDSREASTWLDFLGLEVRSITINGKEHPVCWDGARIQLTGLAAHNIVEVEALGAYSRSGEGLHRFLDPEDGNTYLYTQYEPADSRRVMACFEQPDMKAEVAFTLTGPSSWLLLANGAEESREVEGEVARVCFERTRPLSSYITAIAAGPYYRVESLWERGDLRIPLSVMCRASLAAYLDAEEIFEVTKQGLDFYAEAFDYPYPWGKYDQIFVPEYNLGAMENPGLVTFTEKYVFRGAATVAQHEGRANTILHEMAHMWFGDLVTMKWWDDLWLKESFADYMGSHVSASATRFSQAWVTFANSRKSWAYTQDQLPTTHPIVADIPDLEAAKLNFDGITYAKGAAVLKQLAAYVGTENFFEGARRYFKAHAFGNTSLEDFLAALESASGRDMHAWACSWLQSTGMSTITCDSGVLRQDPPRPHILKVGVYAPVEGKLSQIAKQRVEITEEETPIEIPSAPFILPNDDDLTYAKIRLSESSLMVACESLGQLPVMERGLVWAALWNATRDGRFSPEEFLRLVRRHGVQENNVGILAVIVNHAAYTAVHYVPRERRSEVARNWLAYTHAGIEEADGDSRIAWIRAFAAAAENNDDEATYLRSLLEGSVALPGNVELDAELRWAFIKALAATGNISISQIRAEEAKDCTASGKIHALCAISSLPDVDLRRGAWERAWNDTSISNDQLSALLAGVCAGRQGRMDEKIEESYFSRLLPTWRSRSIEMARRLVRDGFPISESTERVDTWLESHPEAPGALRRLVVEQRDHLARALAVQAGKSYGE